MRPRDVWGSLSSGCGRHLAPAPLRIPKYIKTKKKYCGFNIVKWWFDSVEAELPIPECTFGLTHLAKKRAKKFDFAKVASWTLRPQLNNLPGFGMDHPAGIAQDGYAECVRLTTLCIPP